MKYLSIPLFLLMWGCATPEQVIQETINSVIRYDTVKVTLPQDVRYDTVYINDGQGESIKYIVKVDTHRVYIKGKERIIYVPITDTITITKTNTVIQSPDFFGGITFKDILIGSFIGFLALIGLRIAKVI